MAGKNIAKRIFGTALDAIKMPYFLVVWAWTWRMGFCDSWRQSLGVAWAMWQFRIASNWFFLDSPQAPSNRCLCDTCRRQHQSRDVLAGHPTSVLRPHHPQPDGCREHRGGEGEARDGDQNDQQCEDKRLGGAGLARHDKSLLQRPASDVLAINHHRAQEHSSVQQGDHANGDDQHSPDAEAFVGHDTRITQ